MRTTPLMFESISKSGLRKPDVHRMLQQPTREWKLLNSDGTTSAQCETPAGEQVSSNVPTAVVGSRDVELDKLDSDIDEDTASEDAGESMVSTKNCNDDDFSISDDSNNESNGQDEQFDSDDDDDSDRNNNRIDSDSDDQSNCNDEHECQGNMSSTSSDIDERMKGKPCNDDENTFSRSSSNESVRPRSTRPAIIKRKFAELTQFTDDEITVQKAKRTKLSVPRVRYDRQKKLVTPGALKENRK